MLVHSGNADGLADPDIAVRAYMTEVELILYDLWKKGCIVPPYCAGCYGCVPCKAVGLGVDCSEGCSSCPSMCDSCSERYHAAGRLNILAVRQFFRQDRLGVSHFEWFLEDQPNLAPLISAIDKLRELEEIYKKDYLEHLEDETEKIREYYHILHEHREEICEGERYVLVC